ncbi:CNNM domain-containing protein, partial [Acinetobacter baumannii]
MIVMGNTCATIIASSLLTFLVGHYWGDMGMAIATAVLALAILFFCEALPKSLAALKPERFALPASLTMQFFIFLFAPAIW